MCNSVFAALEEPRRQQGRGLQLSGSQPTHESVPGSRTMAPESSASAAHLSASSQLAPSDLPFSII